MGRMTRNIEHEMLAAIKDCRNWSQGNTTVVIGAGIASVLLHGALLGTYDYLTQKFTVHIPTLVEYHTRTAVSRLRALGVNIYRKEGKLMLNDKPLTPY